MQTVTQGEWRPWASFYEEACEINDRMEHYGQTVDPTLYADRMFEEQEKKTKLDLKVG